jgi:hypothetical protein
MLGPSTVWSGGRGFLSLANSIGVNYEVRADRINLPFVNLALNTGLT